MYAMWPARHNPSYRFRTTRGLNFALVDKYALIAATVWMERDVCQG